MGFLIDSTVLINLERRRQVLADFAQGREDEEMFISVISASELLHGVHRAETPHIRAKRLAFVEAVLNSFPLLEIDLATARLHAELWSELGRRGRMIGIHDSWLAATCLAYGLDLVTDNRREFERVPGLKIAVWE